VKANRFKLLKKNQVQAELNSCGTRNNLVGAVTDVVLSSVEKVGFNHSYGSVITVRYATITVMMTDCTAIVEEITVGNGSVMFAEKKGKLRCEILKKNGESLTITLEDIKYVPSLWVNLFIISNGRETIKLMKGDIIILFDRQVITKNGFVPQIKMRPVLSDVGAATVETRKRNSKNKINVNNKK
jgi:hypothetical protein